MKFYEIVKIDKKKIQPVGQLARDPLFNPLNAELNPICHFLALLGGATIVVVSRLRVKATHNTEYMYILLQYYRFCVASVIFRQYVCIILKFTTTKSVFFSPRAWFTMEGKLCVCWKQNTRYWIIRSAGGFLLPVKVLNSLYALFQLFFFIV
jgi:hypothetical protein